MGDTESDMIHRLHSSNPQFSSGESGKRGVPPTSPYSQIPKNHARSMSQPSSFFSFDSLPPLSPSPFRDPHDDRVHNNPSSFLPPSPFTRCNSTSSSSPRVVPPRKYHRRSNSDIPPRPLESSSVSVKKEGPLDRDSMDDLFSAYMNLDNIDSLNSSDNLDGASGTKTNNGSDDTEGETSSVNYETASNLKRRACAAAGDIPPTTRHYRSVSVDSCFMDKLSFGEDSLKPPISRNVSPTNSVDGAAAATFSIEFKNGDFTAAEMKKIMSNDKLSEMAMSDPKRVKRILANRQSAARSKERKMRYIVELEHKVQTLQTEATTLSAQLTLLQRDMMGLTNQNNELKFRLQAMEQQARLRDALNEALNGEVQRLKLAIGESSHNEEADRSKMQSLNAEMFQQLNISQLRHQSQNGTMSAKPESNE